MAELKTKANDASVEGFLASVSDATRRAEMETLVKLMKRITRTEPKMWGDSMVGFGNYHYTYATGREGDWFIVGFSPRKQNLTVYLMCGFDILDEELQRLGKFKLGKCCLYIKNLTDIDLKVLESMLKRCTTHMKKHQSCGN
jgi:hypothetical protein